MLRTSAGVEPATSWSPVRRRIQLSHRGRLKPTVRFVRPTKTKINLHTCTVWLVFADRKSFLQPPASKIRTLCPYWMDIQTDLSLCWLHKSIVGFVMRWLIYISPWEYVLWYIFAVLHKKRSLWGVCSQQGSWPDREAIQPDQWLCYMGSHAKTCLQAYVDKEGTDQPAQNQSEIAKCGLFSNQVYFQVTVSGTYWWLILKTGFFSKWHIFIFWIHSVFRETLKKIILPSSYLLSNWRSWVSRLLCCDVVNISNDIKQIAHEISPICKAKITGSSLCVWWQRPESFIALSTINTDWAISLEVSQREIY